MKTIFITTFHSFISRNIIGTPIIDLFLGEGFRVVILVFPKKEQFFIEKYGRDGVAIETVPRELIYRDAILRYLALFAMNTRSLKIKRKTEMRGSGVWLSLVISHWSLRSLSYKVIRLLSYWLTPKNKFSSLFEKYKPNIVFSTDIQNENDVRMLVEAKSWGIKTVGMVRAWDNLATKGLIRFVPDKLIVHNEIMKGEALALQGIPAEWVKVVGIPHYDHYLSGKHSSREEFFRKIGGDAKRKLVLFAPTGDRYLANNTIDKDIVDILDKTLPENFQILVRLPPTDKVNGIEEENTSERVLVVRPSKRFKGSRTAEISCEDDEHLIDTLFHSDLVVSGPSTMCVDAALFDKPIILTAFDGMGERSYYESIRRYFDYNHWDAIKKSGGAYLAENKEAFVAKVKEYIGNPALDKECRRKLIEEQTWKLDGKACERVVEVIKLLI